MKNNIINQLPSMKMGEELKEALAVLPEYDAEIRNADITERLLALSNIYDIYIPSNMSVEIYSKIYLSMLRSLQNKEGTITIKQRYENYNIIKHKEHRGIIGGSDSYTIIGISGVGKSTAIGRAISVATENIVIDVEEPAHKVIPCVICQCPHDCSVKSMLLDILRNVDEVIGTNYCERSIKAGATTDMLIGNVSTVALNHIGLLVIDEIENVVNHRNGDMLVAMLTQLINNAGISICLVGTPETELFFEQTAYLARRALGLRYEALPFNNAFIEFCRVVYGYQYVKNAEPFTEGVAMWLYEHSKGVPALVISLLHDVQEMVILDGTEKITISALEELYRKQYGMITKLKPIKFQKPKQEVFKVAELSQVEIKEDISIIEVAERFKGKSVDPVAELSKYFTILEVAI